MGPAVKGPMPPMPCEPLVSQTASLMKVWMMSPKAMVATARYGPARRSAGTPRMTPNTIDSAMAQTTATG